MDRAHALLVIKSVTDGARRTFTGIATTPTPDRMGDIVEPKGAQFKLSLPLLWQHDGGDPIGWITSAKVTDAGIEIEGEVAEIADDGPLSERLRMAWQYLKNKLVRGLSIGFNPVETARLEGTYSYRFIKWDWLELSAVTIPANQDASITLVKSIDRQHLAALGREGPPGDRNRPGASGHRSGPPSGGPSSSRSRKGNAMNLQEMIEARATKNARLKELIEARTAESRAFSDDEGVEFDALSDEVKGLDDDIRVARYHAANGAAARQVDTKADNGRSGPDVQVRKQDPQDLFPGQSFTRLVIAKTLARMNDVTVGEVAEARWGKSHPNLVRYIKAAVAGGGTGTGEWGAELAAADTRYTGDFVEYLYSKTVFDSLPLRSIPARVHVKGQDGAATGYWVGESKAIPATKVDFNDVELTPLKVAALAVMSLELMRDSTLSAEMLVRDALAEASAQRVDTTFLSTSPAIPGVAPAGILNGVAPLSSAGSDEEGLRADIAQLYAPFLAAKNASNLALITNPGLAKHISLLTNALGQTSFAGLTAQGGSLLGDKIYTGDNVGAGDLILLKPSDIWKIGDSGVEVSVSREATIEQDNAPTAASDTPTGATTTQVNMFQTDSVALKVVRRINYAKRRNDVVQYIDDAAYAPAVIPSP